MPPTDRVGRTALRFGGHTSNVQVNSQTPDNITLGRSYTIAFWVRWMTEGSEQYEPVTEAELNELIQYAKHIHAPVVFSAGCVDTPNYGLQQITFYLRPSGMHSGYGRLCQANIKWASPGYNEGMSCFWDSAYPSWNTWEHWAVVVDDLNTIKVYNNGYSRGTITLEHEALHTPAGDPNRTGNPTGYPPSIPGYHNYIIGNAYDTGIYEYHPDHIVLADGSNQYYGGLQGDLDEFKVWKRALSASEIYDLCHGSSYLDTYDDTYLDDSSLIMKFHIDEGSGSSLGNLGNGANGAITNCIWIFDEPSPSRSESPSPSPSESPSISPSASISPSESLSPSASPSATPWIPSSASPSGSGSPSASISKSPSPSVPPSGLEGTLYVVDSMSDGRIVERDPDDLSYKAEWIYSNYATWYSLSYIAVKDEYVYVANYWYDIRKHYRSDFSVAASVDVDDYGQIDGKWFSADAGIDCDGTYVYVASSEGRIYKLNASDLSYTGVYVDLAVSQGKYSSYYDYDPAGLSTDGTYVYLVTFYTSQLWKFNCSDLSFVSKIGTEWGGPKPQWGGVTVNPTNGDVYACVYGDGLGDGTYDDIWKQSEGLGSFAAQSAGQKKFDGIAVNTSDGSVYACVYSGDIWKQTYGVGSFVAQGAGTKNWSGIAVNSSNGDVFGCVYGGGVWKQTGGTGSFVEQGAGTKNWRGVTVNSSTGDVFGCVYGGDIWKQTGGTGSFAAQSAGTKNWYGVTVNPSNSDVFGCVYGGSIWKQSGGSGSFVDYCAGEFPELQWRGIAVDSSNGDIFSCELYGSIWKQTGGSGLFELHGMLGDNDFNYPIDVCTDGTYLWITDSDNYRIKKHNCSNLSYVSKITLEDLDHYPRVNGICVDSTSTYIYNSIYGYYGAYPYSYDAKIEKRNASDLALVNTGGVYGTDPEDWEYPFDIAYGEAVAAPTISISPSISPSPSPSLPEVLTIFADPVNMDNAMLHGEVNPNGAETTVWFEYGTTPGLIEQSTSPMWAGSGINFIQFYDFVYPFEGLSTVHYFRAVAENEFGIVRGQFQAFFYVAASEMISGSATPSRSASISPSASESPSATVSPSASISPSASESPSASGTPSVSISPSISPSASASPSPGSVSESVSKSVSPSASVSASRSPSASVSKSPSPSVSPSASISKTESPSVSLSISPSASVSKSPSASPSPSISPSASMSPSPSIWLEEGPNSIFYFTDFTGGMATALDSIDGRSLYNNDRAFVIVNGVFYLYYLDSDLGGVENAPLVISPDTNAGSKRWVQTVQA